MEYIADDQSDRFYGLIHNYVVARAGEIEYQPLISHFLTELDQPLSRVCNALEKSDINGFNEIAANLASNELNFFAFTDALRTILSIDAAGLTYVRVLGAVTACGAYAKRLTIMEDADDLPDYYCNAERYKNQIHQSILYMSKILDMQMERQWTPESGLSFDGFCQYLIESDQALMTPVVEDSWHGMTPVLVVAGIGLATIVFIKLCSNNTYLF